jgi:hypothetical protein
MSNVFELAYERSQLSQLQEQCDRVVSEIADIKEQIGRAKANAQATGDYSDSDWYHRANRALRHKQAEHQRLLRSAADARRLLRRLESEEKVSERTFERVFMAEAKALLSDTTYREIIVRTRRITGETT